jgi:hypothetical protein
VIELVRFNLNIDLSRLKFLHPPLLIFIALLLVTTFSSLGIIQYTFSSHLSGEYLNFENQYVEFKFPPNWYALSGEYKNETIGNVYNVLFASPNHYAFVALRIFDEKATQSYFTINNVDDAHSVVINEAYLLYQWALEFNNENATFLSIENGTFSITGYPNADYSKFIIGEAIFETDVYYDLESMFISYIKDQNIVQFLFWAKDEDYIDTYEMFEIIFNSAQVKI